MSANIVMYFNGDILTNTSEGMTFICDKPAYFSISYTISFADLETRLCRYIEVETLKNTTLIFPFFS